LVEEPLEIRLNGTAITVNMRTPGSDVELAQGFLLTEVLIKHRDDIHSVRYCRGTGDDGLTTFNVLDVTLSAGVELPTVDITRNFYSTPSCGVCGKASLDAVELASMYVPADDPCTVSATTLIAMPTQLRSAQKVFKSTGGTARRRAAAQRRRVADRARGRWSPQRRRQDYRLGPGTARSAVDRHRPSGEWPRLVRTYSKRL
jgi:formate dehydrogenase assembly factor FdhD